jgi:ribonuclease-3
VSTAVRASLEEALGYDFVRAEYLERALTHRSVGTNASNNETLEFLGDAVLDLAVSDLLMRAFPEAREGDLSKHRAGLVNTGMLAAKARRLGLAQWIRLGKGEEKSGGRAKDSILGAAYEALLGAIYLDGGYEAARRAVESDFATDVGGARAPGEEDYKTRLQELTQQRLRLSPVYQLAEEIGPDHDKRFVTVLTIDGRAYGRGTGTSKKAAEQAAAMQALERLAEEWPDGS